MCFSNDPIELAKFRARKSPITVWKRGDLDEKTGRVYTEWDGDQDRVWWVKGKVTKPTRIRQPLKGRASCTSGLYFYTKLSAVPSNSYVPRELIKARVNPQDIIAVSSDDGRQTVCCVAAKVIDAPNPCQRKRRLKWLTAKITGAKVETKHRKETIQQWLAEQEDKAECLERMIAEAEDLGPKRKKKGSKRASKSR